MSAHEKAFRVVVYVKQTSYARYVLGRKDRESSRLLAKRDPTMRASQRTHEEHERTLDSVLSGLAALGARVQVRFKLPKVATILGVDLVVTVGGDGTLLSTSHAVGPDTPILGINSAPSSSVGFFCAATAENAQEILHEARWGRLREARLARMHVAHNGDSVSARVLNEALYCHRSPAATSRYILRLGDTFEEEQRSSGIWVGPPAGSTAAQRSAGGKVQPLRAERLQFVVREPYTPLGKPLGHVRGLVGATMRLDLRCKMRDAVLFLDGAPSNCSLALGDSLAFEVSREPLSVLGLTRSRSHKP